MRPQPERSRRSLADYCIMFGPWIFLGIADLLGI